MLIEFTQKDIDNGEPRSPSSCPLALAIRRAGLDVATIGLYDIYYRDQNKKSKAISLPDKAVTFRMKVDWANNPQPFLFELDID